MKKDTSSSLKPRVCLVCGDQSNGYNFGALSCESCKAFFRRNAKKSTMPPCEFGNNCLITVKTRKFCGTCRLNKCINVGMKETAILDDFERIARQEKVRANRERRATTNDYVSSSTLLPEAIINSIPSTPSLPSQSHSTLRRLSDTISQDTPLWIDSPIRLTTNTTGRTATSSSTATATIGGGAGVTTATINRDCLQGTSTTTTTLPIDDTNAHDFHNKMICLNAMLCKDNSARLLTQEEWNSINDLRQAFEASFLSYDLPPEGSYTLSNLVNTSGFIVRKLISFAKKLSDFSVLAKECQVALLKGVVLNTLFLRSANYYDVERDVWITPNGYIPTTILAEVTGLQRLYEEHSKYCRTFRSIVGHDNTLVALMQVLCLFSPERDKTIDRQHIAEVQDRYIVLLKHYLEAQYGYAKARQQLTGVLGSLDELQHLTDRHGIVLWRIDPATIDPLMLEIFSLNEVQFLARGSQCTDGLTRAFENLFDAWTSTSSSSAATAANNNNNNNNQSIENGSVNNCSYPDNNSFN